MSVEPPLLCVVGPTGSGKTALAVRLAELGCGEIVSADSVQVYRHFDIGSAKPTAEERGRAPHHLVDLVEPNQPLEAAQWAQHAEVTLRAIRERGQRPLLCGGTFLWIRALLYGLAEAPPGDPARRAEHQRLVAEEGRPALHRRLATVDPESAARLHPNDLVRVSRALEVHELTGRKLSELQAAHGFRTLKEPARLVGIRWAPADLDARLALRCQQMFAAGWVEEVRQLLQSGHGATRPMGAVGYRQIREALQSDDRPTPAQLEQLQAQVLRATRVFARRQRTWLRDAPVRWLQPEEAQSDDQLRALLREP